MQMQWSVFDMLYHTEKWKSVSNGWKQFEYFEFDFNGNLCILPLDGILSKVRGAVVTYYHEFNDISHEFRWASYVDPIPSVKSKLFPKLFIVSLITAKIIEYEI